MRWFTADTHFGHENIIRYSGRPFATVAEMNESLVQRHNNAVGTQDAVWWLGDVVMGDAEANLGLVAECRGSKTLVVGNHDRVFTDPHAKRSPNPRWNGLYHAAGFETIIHRNATLTLANDVTVVMCHFPYVGDSHDGTDSLIPAPLTEASGSSTDMSITNGANRDAKSTSVLMHGAVDRRQKLTYAR